MPLMRKKRGVDSSNSGCTTPSPNSVDSADRSHWCYPLRVAINGPLMALRWPAWTWYSLMLRAHEDGTENFNRLTSERLDSQVTVAALFFGTAFTAVGVDPPSRGELAWADDMFMLLCGVSAVCNLFVVILTGTSLGPLFRGLSNDEDAIKKIQAAYQTLKDADSRGKYRRGELHAL